MLSFFVVIFWLTKDSIEKSFAIYYIFLERSFWDKLKLNILLFRMFISNYVYVYLMPWYIWSASFLTLLLAGNFNLLYVIVGLKAYYVLFSLIFDLLYEKSNTFSFYVNKLFFSGDRVDFRRFLTFFTVTCLVRQLNQ